MSNKVIEMGLAESVNIYRANKRPYYLPPGRVHSIWGTLKHSTDTHVCVSVIFNFQGNFESAATHILLD
jgi:hypothetical protein